jgi:hypothetical protein
MYFKVHTFLANNLDDLALRVSKLPAYFNKFRQKVALLEDYNIQSAASPDDRSVQKQITRNELQLLGSSVAGGLKALGIDSKDPDLIYRSYFNHSLLDVGRDTDVYDHCEKIHLLARDNAEPLSYFGINQARLKEFHETLRNYHSLLQPDTKSSKALAVASDGLEEHMDEIDNMLIAFDGMIETQITATPELFDLYFKARSLLDNSSWEESTPDLVANISPGDFHNVISIPYTPGRRFKVKNTGADNLNWGLSENIHNFTHGFHNLPANTISSKLSEALSQSGDNLLFLNYGDTPVVVEITIIE